MDSVAGTRFSEIDILQTMRKIKSKLFSVHKGLSVGILKENIEGQLTGIGNTDSTGTLFVNLIVRQGPNLGEGSIRPIALDAQNVDGTRICFARQN